MNQYNFDKDIPSEKGKIYIEKPQKSKLSLCDISMYLFVLNKPNPQCSTDGKIFIHEFLYAASCQGNQVSFKVPACISGLVPCPSLLKSPVARALELQPVNGAHLTCGWVPFSVMWLEFLCPTNQYPKSTIKKKSPQTFAHLVNFSKHVSAMFDNHTILLFWL